jgi:hypothetical protein
MAGAECQTRVRRRQAPPARASRFSFLGREILWLARSAPGGFAALESYGREQSRNKFYLRWPGSPFGHDLSGQRLR